MTYQDDMQQKLAQRYPLNESGDPGDQPELQVTALLQRYKRDQGLDTWEQYVAHVAAASASGDFNDDQAAFWAAFVP